MIRLFRSPLLSILSIIAGSAAAQQPAQWNAPLLRVVDSIGINTQKEDLYGQPMMALRRDGSMALASYGRLVLFDSLGRRRWVRDVGRDVRYIAALTWRDDSLVVIDNNRDYALLVGSNGGVGDLVEFPDFVRPLWKDRKTMPAYGALDVMTMVDTFFIGTPRRAHQLGFYGGVASAKPAETPVVRVNYDGIIQTRLGTVLITPPKGDVMSVLPDGRLIVFRPVGDSTAFVAISPMGDTLFNRRLSKVRVVFGAIGGPDGTIWVTSSQGGNVFTHTAFDARGIPMGRVELPSRLRAGAGDASHLWVFEARQAKSSIVRYTLAGSVVAQGKSRRP